MPIVSMIGVTDFYGPLGDGRADYLNVNRDTGDLTAYINNCAYAGGPKPEEGPPPVIDNPEEFCAVVGDDSKLSQTAETWKAKGMDKQVVGLYVTHFTPLLTMSLGILTLSTAHPESRRGSRMYNKRY